MSRPPREPDLESGFSSPAIVDSRRLMGPNLLHAGPGAVLDVSLDCTTPDRNARLLTAWHERAVFLGHALDWPDTATAQREYAGGASLFLHAPIDQLMTATEVSESAWVFAESVVDGAAATGADASLAALLVVGRTEAHSALRAIWNEAARRRLNVTFDDTAVAVGTGIGSVTWPGNALPAVDAIDWPSLRDIPIVLVTGSNGKTTVVRMVAAMARATGHTVGYTCTDGVWIGGVQVERGDYSGPAGARRVLQDPTVTLAVLETARGGILRRGLAMQHAAVAAVVTLSADHFGGYGIDDLAALAEVKLVVGHAVRETGTLVYNGSVPELESALATYSGRTASVRIDDSHEMNPATLAGIPATLNGSATHNVLNAAIALTIANALNLGPEAQTALRKFGADPRDNIGRLMLHEFGGITVVVDYAHNPQSVAALIDATRHVAATRRAITLGTGGDRDDVALQDIAKAAFDSGIIDLYIAKEMPKFLRGRAPGAISGVLLTALRALGATNTSLASAPDDMTAVRAALHWARTGDLLLLTVHDQRDEVLSLLADLAANEWHPHTPLP